MIWVQVPSCKRMVRAGVDCRYISHLPNERETTIGAPFLRMHYKEGVLYVDIKQLGVVVSVNIMKVWETQCFCVIQNQREYALQHTSKHA